MIVGRYSRIHLLGRWPRRVSDVLVRYRPLLRQCGLLCSAGSETRARFAFTGALAGNRRPRDYGHRLFRRTSASGTPTGFDRGRRNSGVDHCESPTSRQARAIGITGFDQFRPYIRIPQGVFGSLRGVPSGNQQSSDFKNVSRHRSEFAFASYCLPPSPDFRSTAIRPILQTRGHPPKAGLIAVTMRAF